VGLALDRRAQHCSNDLHRRNIVRILTSCRNDNKKCFGWNAYEKAGRAEKRQRLTGAAQTALFIGFGTVQAASQRGLEVARGNKQTDAGKNSLCLRQKR